MILATKTLLQSLSAYCVSRCYPCQHCVARCHTGEFTTFVNKYQFSNFEVGHGRDKTSSGLSNCASNGSNIRSHWLVRDFGYEYLMGASSS